MYKVVRFGMLCCLFPVCAFAEPLAVYENFDSNQINPARWSTSTMERRIESSSGTLRLMQRDWAETDSNSGTVGRSHGLGLANGTRVSQLQATVRITDYEAVGCNESGGAATIARARLVGAFFNTGNRSTGSNVGDLGAQIWIRRDSTSGDAANVLRVGGNVFICTDATCAASSFVGGTDLGTINVGGTATLALEWDKPGKRIVFVRDDGSHTGQVAYTQNDSAYPGAHFMSLGTRTDVANCTGSPRPRGMVDARFDQVKVNQSAIQ